jgi:Cu(I)/Ag(I) efflux system membrane fusion protein
MMRQGRNVLFAAAGIVAGWYAAIAVHGTNWSFTSTQARDDGVSAFSQCPMHPWIKSALLGKCTVCGMALVPSAREGAGHNKMATNEVLLPPECVSASGIQTALVKRSPLERTLRFAGKFEEDASTHAVISATVEGRIDGLGLVHNNGQVTQRQPLANIFSRTLLAVAKEYKEALDRDENAAAAAKRKLEQYGLVWEQIKTIPLRQEDDLYFGILSPRTGTVVKSYVSEGQYVREGDKLFEITNSAKLWFMFPAFEPDLTMLEAGQVVDIEPASLPGEKVRARITAIGQHLDEVTHSVHVRVEVENPKGRLRLNGDGTGVINIQAPEVLAIPRAAVLWPGGTPRVYLEKQAGVYEPRTVQLGRAGDHHWEVLTGLREGERVVTSGGVLIDGQAQLNHIAGPTEP